ncbi:MAG: hypothetical protein ACR2PA_26285 [Hyphomicrobiaceae bacterium]
MPSATTATGQDRWRPAQDNPNRRPAYPATADPWNKAPARGSRYQTGPGAQVPQVERGELAPVMSQEAGLPFALWQGLTASDVEELLAPLELPSGSPVLQSLWTKMLATDTDGDRDPRFTALRVQALYKSGQTAKALQVAQDASKNGASDPTLVTLRATLEIVTGNADAGCRSAKLAGRNKSKIAKALRGDLIVLIGYCAALTGNKSAAGLAADLARDEGHRSKFTLAILEAIATGRESRSKLPRKVQDIDYLLLKQAGFEQTGRLIERATPALLAMLAFDRTLPAATRIAAAEAAAKRNVINPSQLVEVYRSLTGDGAAAGDEPGLKRVRLFQDAEYTRTPLRRTRIIRTLIDLARRDGLALPVLIAVRPIVEEIRPAQEISWFSFTAIEVLIASGDYRGILPWVALAGSADRVFDRSLDHWRMLADIADPEMVGQSINFAPLERMATTQRLSDTALHRLTAVLDALDYNIPIPVWDIANRAPQSTAGQLPPTGILTQLLDASKKKQAARTALLALRTIGGADVSKTHTIALGDAIRGLKRAGFVREAKRLAFEAIFPSWPRPRGF